MDLAYVIALFLHISGVLLLFGAIGIETIALRGVRASTTWEQALTWLGAMQSLRLAGPLSGLLIFLPGVYMAVTSWSGAAWTGVGFLALLVIAGTGALITGRRMALIGPVVAGARGPLPSAVREALRDPALPVSLGFRVALALGVVLIMIAKPAALPALGIAVVAAAAGALGGLVVANRPASSSASPEASA